MEMNIIGDKSKFAVEYVITDHKLMLGYGRIWIQNNFYGSKEDLIYLKGNLVGLIENILQADFLDIDPSSLEKENLFFLLEKKLDATSKYIIRSSTFTDDFQGFKFRIKNEIILVWRIFPNANLIFDDLKQYPNSIILGKLDIEDTKYLLEILMRKWKKIP